MLDLTISNKSKSYKLDESNKLKEEHQEMEKTISIDKNKANYLLHIEEKDENKNNYIKANKNVIIGRSKIKELKLTDSEFFKIDIPECSRQHVLIYKTDKGFFLSDNNTTNGTYLKVMSINFFLLIF